MRNVTIGLLILNLLLAVLCAFTLSPIGIFNAAVAGVLYYQLKTYSHLQKGAR